VSIEVRVGDSGGTGSGAVIDDGGYILTNNHVVTLAGSVEEGQDIAVVFNDGTRVKAAIVGRDPKTDLAVLKIDVPNPTVLQLGKSADLSVGDTVIAIGSPLGFADTVTQGIVSALHRAVASPNADGEPAIYDGIQTDAAINQGNSGGPLVDSTGALVGINTNLQSADGGTGNIGLGYAISIDYARPIIETLIRHGRVVHADLGVNAASVSAETSDGARVQNVKDGSAAAKAGIRQGDVITKVADKTIGDVAELYVAVRTHNVGETVPVVLARDGRQLTVQVTLQSD
jgi:S1-C subfamily serine protease